MALSKSATALRRVIKAAVTPAKLPKPWSTWHRATLGLERFAPIRLRKTMRQLACWKNPASKNAAKRSTLRPMLRSGAGKHRCHPDRSEESVRRMDGHTQKIG